MKIKPIHNENDYNEALKELESIFHSELGTEDGDRAEILSILIDKYENENYPISENEPVEEANNELDFNYIYNLVKETSIIEDNAGPNHLLLEKGLKLNEEVGELSAEILKLVDYKHTNESKDQIFQNALIESVDSLIMVFDIMIKLGFTKEQIVETAEKQVNKWLNYIK